MNDRALVSVVTPTWQRHELLFEAIANVREQTYRPLEHIIVSDGPDPDLAALLASCKRRLDLPLRYVSLGRHWTGVLRESYACAPLSVAMLLARGEYQAWLADDERMTPDHIASLVELISAEGADLAYSRAELWWRDDPGRRCVIGTYPPRCGEITNALYRADILRFGTYVFGDDRTSDWATIARWLEAGARAAYLPRVTLTHRVDR